MDFKDFNNYFLEYQNFLDCNFDLYILNKRLDESDFINIIYSNIRVNY